MARATERPLIFTGESVRSILDGNKRQTRRLVKWPTAATVHGRRPLPDQSRWEGDSPLGPHFKAAYTGGDMGDEVLMCRCPSWLPGDRLWVRESWGSGDGMYGEDCDPPRVVAYRSDKTSRQYGIGGDPDSWKSVPDYDVAQWNWASIKWRSPLFMPRWASRLTLEVLSVRAERLQAITEEDARAEGIDANRFRGTDDCWDPLNNVGREYRSAFEYAWGEMHGWDGQARAKPGVTWSFSPWVWVVSFRRVE